MNIYLNGFIHENYGLSEEQEIEVIGEHNFPHAQIVNEGVDYEEMKWDKPQYDVQYKSKVKPYRWQPPRLDHL